MGAKKYNRLVYRINLEELHRLRLERGLSVDAISRQAGISRSVIYSAMQGKASAERSIIKLAKFFGLPATSLIA